MRGLGLEAWDIKSLIFTLGLGDLNNKLGERSFYSEPKKKLGLGEVVFFFLKNSKVVLGIGSGSGPNHSGRVGPRLS